MIKQPTLLLDKKGCLRNMQKMVDKANTANVLLRPHFKTHQSLTIGQWFRDLGVTKATVSSLKMAKYFADGGWNDITVAIPVNILEIDLINEIAEKVTLNLLVENKETVDFLSNHLKDLVNLLIKTDIGYNRTGIDYQDSNRIKQLIEQIQNSNHCQFKGFLTHAGHSYDARSHSEIAAIHNDSLLKMETLYRAYISQFPELVISVGDTPTCSVMDNFGVATEIRPGNFVFYDLMQQQISACSMDEIAVAMACPVIAKHPLRNEIIVHGGGVHFSKDVLYDTKGSKYYGLIVENDGELGWSAPIEGVYMKKLSQEHGTIHATNDFIQKTKIGDIIKILPVHSCMTADLMKQYLTTDGEWIEHLSGQIVAK